MTGRKWLSIAAGVRGVRNIFSNAHAFGDRPVEIHVLGFADGQDGGARLDHFREFEDGVDRLILA
jgi:hypothetical protein